jgi:precorrin-2/cobalt-factor-2 C20-methyltransferase
MAGCLSIVGLGPGDPELMTLKAARIIAASPVVAFFAKPGRASQARGIAAGLLRERAEELRFDYPFTTEVAVDDPRYPVEMAAFYDASACTLAARLRDGQDVALLCEGDPLLYGSAMYLLDRLRDYRTEIVPGVMGMSGCWSRAGIPMVHGDDVLSVLPGTLDEAALARRLARTDAAVIMKVGRNLPKIRAALECAGLLERAVYVERGTMQGERIQPLSAVADDVAPYFSMVLVPGRQRAR